MSFDKGNSEICIHELLVLENKRLTEEVKNLKQLVADMYIAMNTGQACSTVPVSLLGHASTVLHQAQGPTAEDLQYSPDSPYYSTTDVLRTFPGCPPAPPPLPKQRCASPLVSVPPFTGLVRTESLGKKDERERGPGRRDEERYKWLHSRHRASQKQHSRHYPLQNTKHSIPPLQKARPYAPNFSYPQWTAPASQPTYHTHQAPHKQYRTPPEFPYRSRRPSTFIPRPEYKKAREEKKRKLTPIGESYTSVFEKLQALDMLRPIYGNMHPTGKVDYSRRCAYHSGAPGHDTEDCHFLKKDIQALIDNDQIQVEGSDAPDINQNSLPVHDDVYMVGMVCGEDLKAESAMPIVPVGDVSIRANQTLVTMNCAPEIVFEVADRVKGDEMKKTNMSLEKPISNLTRSFISPKEVKSTPMEVGRNEEKQKMLPDSGNFFGISMVHPCEGFNNA